MTDVVVVIFYHSPTGHDVKYLMLSWCSVNWNKANAMDDEGRLGSSHFPGLIVPQVLEGRSPVSNTWQTVRNKGRIDRMHMPFGFSSFAPSLLLPRSIMLR